MSRFPFLRGFLVILMAVQFPDLAAAQQQTTTAPSKPFEVFGERRNPGDHQHGSHNLLDAINNGLNIYSWIEDASRFASAKEAAEKLARDEMQRTGARFVSVPIYSDSPRGVIDAGDIMTGVTISASRYQAGKPAVHDDKYGLSNSYFPSREPEWRAAGDRKDGDHLRSVVILERQKDGTVKPGSLTRKDGEEYYAEQQRRAAEAQKAQLDRNRAAAEAEKARIQDLESKKAAARDQAAREALAKQQADAQKRKTEAEAQAEKARQEERERREAKERFEKAVEKRDRECKSGRSAKCDSADREVTETVENNERRSRIRNNTALPMNCDNAAPKECGCPYCRVGDTLDRQSASSEMYRKIRGAPGISGADGNLQKLLSGGPSAEEQIRSLLQSNGVLEQLKEQSKGGKRF